MQRHQIPTANYAVCTAQEEVEGALDLFHTPIVVKADGLAAGKGVVICETKEQASAAAQGMFSGQLAGLGGDAGGAGGIS